MSRRLRAIAADTMAIVAQGHYRAGSGAAVDIAPAVRSAMAGTRMYPPDHPLPATGPVNPYPIVEVTDESTLAAARRLGEPVAALVFASARNPGGGFRNGARAQEEDIARASALYACLTTTPAFYEHHRTNRDLRYSDRVGYAPGVPVFRDDAGRLLHQPYHVTMLAAAAPNLRAITGRQAELAAAVPSVLRTRARRILAVAAAHGHRRLVLGAWGCGVFGNDPTTVAAAFTAALHEFSYFDHIVFAILDRTPAASTYRAFADLRKAT
ncbi:MAG: TIGR02452 family protein [Dactylosporangium sp.]|nr:TIGR02452 family protein [Dactylosporangium sp.]NNJ59657.1 TIGR02452 family protein [Dactylosporangium sp.]